MNADIPDTIVYGVTTTTGNAPLSVPVPDGATVTIAAPVQVALPAGKRDFDYWLADSGGTSTSPQLSLTAGADTSVVAHYFDPATPTKLFLPLIRR